ncbi:gamma-glutamyl hydrolase-like [Uranotaenia lowii]|uniref:gamma-glutamyl hydrolase-like n=1 Tax=Uranotaenia lowii TaxID=190385 RepID=UPI002479F852|nr:gamma-glutamyl hydrolase-like [Uranotaenia lowii]
MSLFRKMLPLLVPIFLVLISNVVAGPTLISKPTSGEQLNEEPIFGVLVLETDFSEQYTSYLPASYVKFLEGAGARVVPIWINRTREYYRDILSQLDGVLLPGGAVSFEAPHGYAEAGFHIYQLAKEFNRNGEYFPIWGVCLGFELLAFLAAGRVNQLTDCNSIGQSMALQFKPDFRDSRLFAGLPQDMERILSTESVTANFHQYCITEQNFTSLSKNWRIMSTNRDWNGLEFISSMEHKSYPFYGVQFHPEKSIYEWVGGRNISHSSDAVRVMQYFADFVVDEARKSLHHFDSDAEANRHLVYNFPETFTGANKSVFQQIYLFEQGADYPEKRKMARKIKRKQYVEQF